MQNTTLARLRARLRLTATASFITLSLITLAPAQTPAPDASTAASPTTQPASQPVLLSPFEVSEATDHGYAALNSNSITLFSEELNKLPISADVFDSTFMEDVGARSVESMIQAYSAGAGSSNVAASAVVGSNQPGDTTNTQTLRGLFAPTMQRDGFMPAQTTGATYTSNFDLDRVDIVKGPQSLLYGGGGGSGGVINLVGKQARLGAPTFGSAQYYIDNYGTKFGQLDYGAGTDRVAVRVALIDGTQDFRRQELGGPTSGAYGQIAVRLGTLGIRGASTTIRLTAEQTTQQAQYSDTPAPALATTDPRNGVNLHTLLFEHEMGATNPVTGAAYPAGPIDNGLINWSNVDSFGTQWTSKKYVTTQTGVIVDSTWTSWLSTQINTGYDRQNTDIVAGGQTLDAPGIGGNPLTGWAESITPTDSANNNQTKGMRASALLTNSLFHGTANSKTVLGADYVRVDSSVARSTYYTADSNFNVLINPALTSTEGRTAIAKLWFPVDAGPPGPYAFFTPQAPEITIAGQNYVRQLMSPVSPSLIGPGNPVGAEGANAQNYVDTHVLTHGLFAANFTEWFDGKLTSLLGVRLADIINERYAPVQNQTVDLKEKNFNLGLVYRFTPIVSAYVSGSSSFYPSLGQDSDPYGNEPAAAKGVGEEAGIKIADPHGWISASLAAYHVSSKNEQITSSSSIENDINPSGLNGQYSAGDPPNQWIIVNREAKGAELTLTAQPKSGWNIRLGAAYTSSTVENTDSYGQLYNDQFFENSSGVVTYSNGTPVYVNSTATSAAAAKEVTATTAGAVPLTVALMNTATSVYYANPASINGQIPASSAVGTILKNPLLPTQGTILTGNIGLPISAIQINAAANPNNASYIAPPGVISPVLAGQYATGYPVLSLNLTNSYTFQTGWLKGFEVGGTLHTYDQYRAYYYYTSGITGTLAGAGRQIFYVPGSTTVDGIVGYRYKFRRVSWSTRLNVYNLFNHYQIYLEPDAINGYNSATALNATFNAQPRSYQWTNTISF